MVRGAKVAPKAFISQISKEGGLSARTFGATELDSPKSNEPFLLIFPGGEG